MVSRGRECLSELDPIVEVSRGREMLWQLWGLLIACGAFARNLHAKVV